MVSAEDPARPWLLLLTPPPPPPFPSFLYVRGSNFTECDNQVCHGSDLPAFFLPTEKPDPRFGNYTTAEWNLGITMQQYYANFAATGSPGVPKDGIAWPPYDAVTRQTLNLQTEDMGGLSLSLSRRSEYCAFWDNFGYKIY